MLRSYIQSVIAEQFSRSDLVSAFQGLAQRGPDRGLTEDDIDLVWSTISPLLSGKMIEAWRMIRLDESDYPGLTPEEVAMSLNSIGLYWSFKKEGAWSYNNKEYSGTEFLALYKARIDINDVNMSETLEKAYFEAFHSEFEVELLPGKRIWIEHVEVMAGEGVGDFLGYHPYKTGDISIIPVDDWRMTTGP